MKDIGSLHLASLIDCTNVDEDSDLDIIKNKAMTREAKEQTQIRDDKDNKNGR